jgi:hypothetical protein
MAARKAKRPMRPIPLMPTFMVNQSFNGSGNVDG